MICKVLYHMCLCFMNVPPEVAEKIRSKVVKNITVFSVMFASSNTNMINGFVTL